MGAGRGGDYGNTPNKGGGFVDNLLDLIEKYPLSDVGFFGERARNDRTDVRHIFGIDPLETMRDFINIATKGARIEPLKNGRGYHAFFSDGFEIIYRESSASDQTPSVEIKTKIKSTKSDSIIEVKISKQTFKLRYQKIHFVPQKSKKK